MHTEIINKNGLYMFVKQHPDWSVHEMITTSSV